MPKAIVDSPYNPNDTIKLILSGLGGNYIRESDDIYKAFAQYVYRIYKTPAELYMLNIGDPQSEPAKSDCIIMINIFCPQYVFISVCFCG